MKKFILLITFLTVSTSLAWAAPVPLLRIEEPTDGQIIEAYVVNLKYSLKNFTLKDYHTSLANNPNQGHFLIWLDKEERKPETAVKYYKQSPYLMADVLSGKHTLVVELVNNNGVSFDPKISQTIKFETKAPAGSEGSPVNRFDVPQVGKTNTGEIPLATEESKPWLGYVRYFLLAGVLFLLGLIGLALLKRTGSSKSL